MNDKLITHENLEVRRSWRVGADCKSVAYR